MDMDGCTIIGNSPSGLQVSLTFSRAEIQYDIDNCAYVEADIMPTDDDHARHQVFDVGQEGNYDRVTRVLNLAHAECVEMLYPYTKEVVQEGQDPIGDILDAPETYSVTLSLPPGFSMTTVNLLRHLIHEYLVYRVLADWMDITKPDSRAKWQEKLDGTKLKIQTSLMSRAVPRRRRLKPFP